MRVTTVNITIILDVPDHKNPEAYTCTLQVCPFPYGPYETVKARFWPWLSGKIS